MKKFFKVGCITLLFLFVLAVVSQCVWMSMLETKKNNVKEKAGILNELLVKISSSKKGVATVYFTFQNGTQKHDVMLPFEGKFNVKKFDSYSIMASSIDLNNIYIELTFEGKVINSSSGSGKFPTASCAGIIE